jgi:DNA-binding MarR family transcriptional regulator
MSRDDYESGVGRDDGMELRVWLRLITCHNLIDNNVRQKLHQDYETTLPRFDVLAQLHREGAPLTMGELSRRLMVTNGNVTGLIDRLAREGLVERRPAPDDRRRQLVAMTDRGRSFFEAMAGDHKEWIADMTGDLNAGEMRELFRLLGRLKQSILTTHDKDNSEAAE